MTGAGAPGAAGILHCLWQDPAMHVVAADANPSAVGRYLNTDFETIPRASDPSFVEAVLALCRERDIHVLMPLVTRELQPLADHADAFEAAGTRLPISPAASMQVANDKCRLYHYLEEKGVAVPAFRVVDQVNQFRKAAEELGYPAQPITFKPGLSNGSRGFRIINPLVRESELLFNEKPQSAYITFENAIRVLSENPFPPLLLSEYLPGPEYSVDCLANHGEAVLVVPRLRKKIVNGISVEGVFLREESIIRYATQILSVLGLHGNIGIQVKASASGAFRVLEINPRVQGSISAALGAGINLPLLAIKQELGLPILPEELQVKWGTHFSRYWREVFYQDQNIHPG